MIFELRSLFACFIIIIVVCFHVIIIIIKYVPFFLFLSRFMRKKKHESRKNAIFMCCRMPTLKFN